MGSESQRYSCIEARVLVPLLLVLVAVVLVVPLLLVALVLVAVAVVMLVLVVPAVMPHLPRPPQVASSNPF